MEKLAIVRTLNALWIWLLCLFAFAGLPHAEVKVKGSDLPPDLKELLTPGVDPQALETLIFGKLDSSLCLPFPDIPLQGAREELTTYQRLKGKRIALFFAGIDCYSCVAWARDLDQKKWHPPHGYDRLVTLVTRPRLGELTPYLANKPDVYLAGFPLPGYLAYAHLYPMMFFVSSDGVFEGYQRSISAKPVFKDGGCHAKSK
jgi:hypothetical protein